MEGSRWERWDRWPYRVLAIVLIVASQGIRLLPSLSHEARNVAAIVGLPLTIAGVVLYGGPWMYRVRRAQAEEIRRNPTGKTVPLDDRLAALDHPRARWVGMVLVAVGFSLATAWAIYMAATRNDSAFVGFAIYLFIPIPLFAWVAWRARALVQRRKGNPPP